MKENALLDPVECVRLFWPHLHLYDKQREIMYSVRDNDETFVPAGNDLGKDFVGALTALWFFISRRPCKVVTTSVQGSQLNDVLWGEIRRFVDTAVMPLPIQYNHLKIRQKKSTGDLVGNAELVGQVINKGESLLGRHLPWGKNGEPRTLCIFDEASGIEDPVYETSDTWAHRKLIIGNPYPCTNFFYKGVKAKDLEHPRGERYYRKVIKIRAVDSPNVKLAQLQKKQGEEPNNEVLIPGVLDHETYIKRRTLWDSVRQSIGLDAEFWEGAEALLFPPVWLDEAEERARQLVLHPYPATHIGCDPAEGGDSTCWSVIGEYGLIELISMKTPDTAAVVDYTIDFMRRFGVAPENTLFDRGGGGKQHADRLRRMGYKVQTVAFGETIKSEDRYRFRPPRERKADDEEAYVYKNRRAEMYGLLSRRFDPNAERPFAMPKRYEELRRQLASMPRLYDAEGRIYLPPKNKVGQQKVETLHDILGCSPDEADSLVLANYGACRGATRTRVRWSKKESKPPIKVASL